ncbi:MAG: efflux transporter outer membrane subunit [Pseudomonadota bacterium]
MRYRTRLGIFSTIVLAAGCTVGPDYVKPEFGTDAEWLQAQTETSEARAQWWAAYGDPKLEQLVALAVAGNRDLRQATARVVEARAGSAAARGARLPALATDVSYTFFEQSIESPQAASALIDAGIVPRDGEFYNASLQASWELDLFGGIRRSIEQADANALAALAQRDAVALQVIAETVNAYTDWQGFSQRVLVAQRNIDLQKETLGIIQGKVRLGLTRRLDEVRAIATLSQLEAQVPTLVAARDGARERIAVLVGKQSSALDLDVKGLSDDALQDIAVGTKADLLRRRPDVRIAERLLAAATADQGVATAQFFPSLTLTGSGGFEAGDASNLASGAARTVGIVPFVRWPVFQGGRLRAALAAADARQQQALAAYEQAVLQAFADSEAAIAAYRGARETLVSLRRAGDAAREAESLANRLYRQGLSDYLTLLDSQRQLAEIDDSLIVAENQAMLAATRLYRSLGGGWPE